MRSLLPEVKLYVAGPVENDAVKGLMRARADGNGRRCLRACRQDAKNRECQRRGKKGAFTHEERGITEV